MLMKTVRIKRRQALRREAKQRVLGLTIGRSLNSEFAWLRFCELGYCSRSEAFHPLFSHRVVVGTQKGCISVDC